MQPRFERVSFPGAEGHGLDARLELPDHEPDAFALFAVARVLGAWASRYLDLTPR